MGVFTLSLDCEGLWGMADSCRTLSSGAINNRSLADAYDFLCSTLDRYDICATAAFVSAFAVPREVLLSCRAEFMELQKLYPPWFANIIPRLEAGNDAALDGFEGHDFWRMFADGRHEIAWHGTTHMPLVDAMPAEAITREIALARRLLSDLGPQPTSIVFPRNEVGNLAALKAAGFTSYRESRSIRPFSRFAGIVREWNICDRADACGRTMVNGLHVSPAGFFLNWPSGIRALVPPSVTYRRWISILRSAASGDRHAHMWFHPHNLITALEMRTMFTRLMAEVASLVKGGHMKNRTIGQAVLETERAPLNVRKSLREISMGPG